MNRKTLFGRVTSSLASAKVAQRMEYTHVSLEPLEDRKMLVATVYVNDNWINLDGPTLDIGDMVQSQASDGIIVVAEYGYDAFGTVGGQSLPGAARIYDAIQNTDPGGTVNILGGTYAESDIIIDRPVQLVGQGKSGATQTVLIPEVVSAPVQENFGVGTRSAIIIYAPSVVVRDLRIDGAGNNMLAGSYNYHHGITTLFDSQNGGNYSSIRNGSLPLIELGTPWRANPNETVPNIDINNVSVNNVYWHGVTISPLANKNFDPGDGDAFNLQVRNSDINNVGDVKDINRIGVLLQNLNDDQTSILGNANNLTITNVGVGVKTGPWGTNPVWSNDNNPSNRSRVQNVTVIDPVVRGFDINFGDRTEANRWTVINNNPANNAVGVYMNYSRSVLLGTTITGSKIGIQVQNAPVSIAHPTWEGNASGVNERHPTLGWNATLTGPGIAVPGSVGILIDNASGDQESSNFVLGAGNIVSGYETGIRVDQTAAPSSGLKNSLLVSGSTFANNGTALYVGNNSVVSGRVETSGVVTIAGNGEVDPRMYDWRHHNPYYWESPGNIPGLKENAVFPDPNADEHFTGNVTFGSSSTFSALLTGETGSGMLFDYNSAATYGFSAPPDSPVDGVVPAPYGALFGWFLDATITQNGNGVLSVANAPNGFQYEYMFGANNVPITEGANAGKFQLVGTDISNESHLNMKVKLRPENESRMFAFGLIDFRGNVNAWTIDTTKLSSVTWTTLTFNLLSPAVDLTGQDASLDLTNIAGWVYGGDQGVSNGNNAAIIGFEVDEITRSSVPNSRLNVTGTVNLSGNLDINLGPGFTPTISQQFTIINNDGVDPVVGTFNGIANNAVVSIDGKDWRVNYDGGTGNDVVITFLGDTPIGGDAEVVGRHIFYNQSKFDGNSAAINASDDNAIAPDKVAFNGIGTAPLSAFTNYSRGINGIMVDIEDAAGTLTVNDFTFKVGANNMPSLWANAPAPNGFSVRAGAGVGGSDRVVITWANNAIQNEWLQVIVEGNDALGGFNTNTGLAASDVFFYGNRIGDTFEASPATIVTTNVSDQISVRGNSAFGQPITAFRDFNKDGLVNVNDEIIARSNGGFLTRIINWVPPAAPEAEPAVASDDSGSAVASALAVQSPALSKVPGWISSRLASVDLNTGTIAKVFTTLAEANTPGTRALLLAANEVTNALGLDDWLLESLIEDLG